MKKIVLILALVLPLFFLTACKKEEKEKTTYERIKHENKIIVGTKIDSKPFCFKEDGELKGYDIDLSRLIAKELLGNKDMVEFVELKAGDRIFALNSKQVDVIIASMSTTSKRYQIIDFSIPYYVAGQALLTKNKSNINGLKDLNGKTIGLVLGSTGEGTIRYLLPKAKVRSAKTYTEIFEYLKNGEVDAVLADDSILYSEFKDNKDYKILSKRYSKEYYAVGIRKEDIELKNKIDLILERLQENGSLNLLRAKWL